MLEFIFIQNIWLPQELFSDNFRVKQESMHAEEEKIALKGLFCAWKFEKIPLANHWTDQGTINYHLTKNFHSRCLYNWIYIIYIIIYVYIIINL